MRVCHPLPDALKAASKSASSLRAVNTFVSAALGLPLGRFIASTWAYFFGPKKSAALCTSSEGLNTSSGLSGSASIAALIFASSLVVGCCVFGFSFGIAVDFSVIGFAQADDTNEVGTLAKYKYV
ncbi:MAG: hypothetical protein RLZZ481_2800 [Pseudomonadota bacterium]